MSETKRRFNPLIYVCLALSICLVLTLVLCVILASKKDTKVIKETKNDTSVISINKAVSYSQEEVDDIVEKAVADKELSIKESIKAQLSHANPNTAEMLRNMFPENIVYITPNGYAFDSISDTIPHNNYTRDAVSFDENGLVTYTDENGNTSKMGIDVSQHQGVIDWEKVKKSGVEFAIIRVGFRGYGSGALVEDEEFVHNIEGALDNDIEVGVYFFSQAISKEEMQEEIDFMFELIKPYKITYPVVIDIEKVDDKEARGNKISKEDRTAYTDFFCQEVTKAGYKPMIYGNTYSLFAMLDMEKLYQYDVWFAFYDKYIYYPYIMKAWQYSDTIKIDGIKGNCDMDIWMP